MASKKNRINLTIVILVAFAALMTGLFVFQHLHKSKKINPGQFNGTLLQSPREVNAFALTGIDKTVFNNQSLHGKWTLIFFGFTNCGYLCPTTMAELGKMYRILEKNRVKSMPDVVMISIDPERDSLEKLAGYVRAFDPHFQGARGNSEEVKKMAREMGIAYAKIALPNATDSQNYDIQHSGAVMLFNPDGELNAFFTTPHHADLMAKDYQLLVD
ncbi:SCO family protein [Legionella spiritensis]|uniref:SCO1/SenC family transporter protein n=1 Tax=Legionella spiritensis TaxID=452 RepID=A0A0W0Z8Y2_LEGSP|nr:SCO family protein [Legionella spiritensis]KTD65553.1 SCO1/SenC family transporter protein [Legionella spiritensis]SNV44510.1 SCO1/SenC family protein [Legionella spiritensis]VEG90819.1 SCO1/SenC family protein [Legionella spiritensis]